AKDAAAPVKVADRFFDVHVIDAVAKFVDEGHRVDHLPIQVAGIIVEAEARPVVDSRQGALGGVKIEGDLGGVHFQGELDAFLVEYVYDGVPAVSEVLIAVFDHASGDGRKASQSV